MPRRAPTLVARDLPRAAINGAAGTTLLRVACSNLELRKELYLGRVLRGWGVFAVGMSWLGVSWRVVGGGA